MLDIKYIRSHPQEVKDNCAKRNLSLDVDLFLGLDEQRRNLMQEIETLQAQKNTVSKEIPTISDKAEKQEKIAAMKEVSVAIKEHESTLSEIEATYADMLYQFPNHLSPTAAIGKDEDENMVESTFGEKTVFDFEPKSHHEIGEVRGWIDTKKGSQVSGSRFWYLKGDLVLLQFAIINYALSKLVSHGFEPMLPPFLVREKAMVGTGFFPAEKNEIYTVNPEDDNLFLIGTSEVPITSYHTEEVIDLSTPKMYTGYSTCFRREAGSYGKDMAGILRGHQFDKIEMVVFCKPEESEQMHRNMVEIEEEIWQGLGIPYQKVNICSGDLGNPAMKKYDLEAWMPGQEKYREVTSCSNVGEFQSRRLGIKYRDADGDLQHVHTLNGTVIAFSRCLIALMENYQNEDMTIRIPEALVPFMSGKTVL